MVVAKENEAACTADIEGGRSMGERVADDFKDARVGYWGLFEEAVSRVAICDCGEERGCGCHFLFSAFRFWVAGLYFYSF
jgi:hypothetical protein